MLLFPPVPTKGFNPLDEKTLTEKWKQTVLAFLEMESLSIEQIESFLQFAPKYGHEIEKLVFTNEVKKLIGLVKEKVAKQLGSFDDFSRIDLPFILDLCSIYKKSSWLTKFVENSLDTSCLRGLTILIEDQLFQGIQMVLNRTSDDKKVDYFIEIFSKFNFHKKKIAISCQKRFL